MLFYGVWIMLFIVSMGIPKQNVKQLNEGFRFEKAVIQLIDWNRKKVVKEIEYSSPEKHVGKNLSIQFKGSCLHGEDYFVVTNTEILRYDLNSWCLEDVISLKSFNDLHGVIRSGNCLYIVNTGLEMIQIFDLERQVIVDEINMTVRPTWERFDPDKDYRLIATTKPHEAHVNHVFQIDGQIWATRGQKREAVNIKDFSQKIQLPPVEGDKVVLCHDGIVRSDKVYFTTVDSHILVFDKENKALIDDYDIRSMNTTGYSLGWTRGLEIVGERAFLGLSKMRATTFKDYTSWFIRGQQKAMPSSILNIDMNKREITDYYIMENHKGHAIYTISLLP